MIKPTLGSHRSVESDATITEAGSQTWTSPRLASGISTTVEPPSKSASANRARTLRSPTSLRVLSRRTTSIWRSSALP